jgi:hypothetical protein
VELPFELDGGNDGAGAGAGSGAGAAIIGAGFGAGGFLIGACLAGALCFGAAFFAFFFGAAFFFADFTSFFFLRAGAAFFFFADFFFAFAFFAMMDLPILATGLKLNPLWPPPVQATAGADGHSTDGHGPPVAQSINSTVWTIGSAVPAAICVMQPILPAAITSGRKLSMESTLRSRNRVAMAGWRIL